MAGTNLYPDKQSEFATWLNHLATTVAASPATYGVSVAQAATMTASNAAFQTAYATAIDPTTATTSARLAKDQAMKTARKDAKNLADIIRAFPSITPELLNDLGIPVPAQRQPVPPPDKMAQVDPSLVGPNTVRVRIHGDGPLRRGKPAQSTGCIVMSYIGAVPPLDSRLWTLEGTTSKTVADINFPDDVEPGATVWIAACFVNAKLEQGPMTYPPVQLRLPGRLSATAATTTSDVKLAA